MDGLCPTWLDCSGKKPLEGPLKEELEEALALAEHFTKRYSTLLRSIEEQMFNTSAILDFLNQQFSWVSTLANNTNTNPIFQVQTVSGIAPRVLYGYVSSPFNLSSYLLSLPLFSVI